MNRIGNKLGKSCLWLVCLVVGLVLAIGSLADVAIAGDGDGITGYSMRLKNKDFDGSDGSTGEQSTLSLESKHAQGPVIQEAYQQSTIAHSQKVFFVDWRWFLRVINLR